MYQRSANPDLLLQLERERSDRKEEIAGLKREILASTLKVNSISSLVSQKLPAEGVASQEEVARGLMAVTRGLEVVESGLEEERRKRKDEIASLTRSFHETMNGAAGKIREELSLLHQGIGSTPRIAELSDNTNVSAEQYNQLKKVQDQLFNEIASLSSTIDSAPWAKSMEQAGQILKDRAADSEILTVRINKLADLLAGFQVELATSQGQLEAAQASFASLRTEMQQEVEGLRLASQGQSDATQAAFADFKAEIQKDIQTKSDATAMRLNARLDMLNDQMLENIKQVDGLTRRVEAAEPGRSKQIGTVTAVSGIEDGTLRQLNTRIDLLAERSSEVHDQFSGLTQTLQAVERRLVSFTNISDRQDTRIDKVADDFNCINAKVVMYGQTIQRLETRMSEDFSVVAQQTETLQKLSTEAAETAVKLSGELKQSVDLEKRTREKETSKLTERITAIISGRDPEVESAFERIGSQIRATCLIAVREELSLGQSQSNGSEIQLPRAGEQWIFTGNAKTVDVFSSSSALPKQKIHGLECYSHGKLRRIEVMQSVAKGQRFVYFQGTRGMEFLKGWAALFDEKGNLNLQFFDPKKLRPDSWL